MKKMILQFKKYDVDGFLDEQVLIDELESSEEFSRFKEETEKRMEEQWQDLLLSWIIVFAVTKFWNKIWPWKKLTKRQESKILELLMIKSTALMYKLSWYEKYPQKVKEYLLSIMTIAWQKELDYYLWKDKKSFKITNTAIKTEIASRAKKLLDGLDKYTLKKFAQDVLSELKKGTGTLDMTYRIWEKWKELAKVRAQRIAVSETVAATEHIRQEVARLNGVTKKKWRATIDEKTCPVCKELNKEWEIDIDRTFLYGYMSPPAHNHCRCMVEYVYNTDLLLGMKKSYSYYDRQEKEYPLFTNPELVWTWWNGYEWKDKKFFDFYNELIKYWIETVKRAMENLEKGTRTMNPAEEILIQAKERLTVLWYIQLMRNILSGVKWRPKKININF